VDTGDKTQPGDRLATDLPGAGLFVELGLQRPYDIERLKNADGVLVKNIRSAIKQWSGELGIDGNVDVVPIVLLYRSSRAASSAKSIDSAEASRIARYCP
jgi:hypothetical protein